YWYEVEERSLLGLYLVQKITERIQVIKERMCTPQSRQKSYVDVRRRLINNNNTIFFFGPLESQEENHVFLKVTLKTMVGRSTKVKKLCPSFMRPFQILEKFVSIAYQLAFLLQLSSLHVLCLIVSKVYVPNNSHEQGNPMGEGGLGKLSLKEATMELQEVLHRVNSKDEISFKGIKRNISEVLLAYRNPLRRLIIDYKDSKSIIRCSKGLLFWQAFDDN
ncbi:hypothetical protein CR513_60230, partial [Mucuna pruriens]